MFDAFEPWKLTLDDVEPVTTGKPSEQGVKFKLPLQEITFFFGAASCKFTKEAANWSQADETLNILRVALDVLVQQGRVELGKKSTSLALHLQPQGMPFKELLRPFFDSNSISDGKLCARSDGLCRSMEGSKNYIGWISGAGKWCIRAHGA